MLVFTDKRYFHALEPLKKAVEVCDINKMLETLPKELSVEDGVSYSFIKKLKAKKFKINTVPSFIKKARAVKKEYELAFIRKAVEIAQRAFNKFLEVVRPGMSELQAAGYLEFFLRAEGSEEHPFQAIVTHSPHPHAQPSARKIKKGIPLVVDFGASFNGYMCDITRTIFFGMPKRSVLSVFKRVLEVQEKMLENIKPGMSGRQAYELSRRMFGELAENYWHGLGHGVGVEIHELPYLSPRSEDVLQNGSVFTVEPGLYFRGKWGIRIEDTVYLKGRVVNLVNLPKIIIL